MMRRKLLYALGLLSVVILLGIYGFRDTLFPAPTCSDNKQNGYETGIDCGGGCARKCPNETIPLSVLWSRALPVSNGVYDLVAYVSNKNQDSAPSSLFVNFTVIDASNAVIFTRRVVTIPPAATDLPVIISNVALPSVPKVVTATLEEGTSYKIDSRFQSVQISSLNKHFENGITPRLYATLRNQTRNAFDRFTVRAVLYDEAGNAFGVGETYVEHLDKEQTADIVFTWKTPFAQTPVTMQIFPVLPPFGS